MPPNTPPGMNTTQPSWGTGVPGAGFMSKLWVPKLEPVTKTITPRQAISPYYDKVPGGFQAALDKAKLMGNSGLTEARKWFKPVPYENYDKPVNVTYGPINLEGLKTNGPTTGAVPGATNSKTQNVSVDNTIKEVTQDSTLAHELTHTVTLGDNKGILKPVGDALNLSVNMWHPGAGLRRYDTPVVDYMTTNTELDPRIAAFKRHYAEATGKLIDSEQSAREAISPYLSGDKDPVSNNDYDEANNFMDIYRGYKDQPDVQKALLQRMLELVKSNDPQIEKTSMENTAIAPVPATQPATPVAPVQPPIDLANSPLNSLTMDQRQGVYHDRFQGAQYQDMKNLGALMAGGGGLGLLGYAIYRQIAAAKAAGRKEPKPYTKLANSSWDTVKQWGSNIGAAGDKLLATGEPSSTTVYPPAAWMGLVGIPAGLIGTVAFKRLIDEKYPIPNKKKPELDKYQQEFNQLLQQEMNTKQASEMTPELRAADAFLTALETSLTATSLTEAPGASEKRSSLLDTWVPPAMVATALGLGALTYGKLKDTDKATLKAHAAREAFKREAMLLPPNVTAVPVDNQNDEDDADDLDTPDTNVIPIRIPHKNPKPMNMQTASNPEDPFAKMSSDQQAMVIEFDRLYHEMDKQAQAEYGVTLSQMKQDWLALPPVLREFVIDYTGPQSMSHEKLAEVAGMVRTIPGVAEVVANKLKANKRKPVVENEPSTVTGPVGEVLEYNTGVEKEAARQFTSGEISQLVSYADAHPDFKAKLLPHIQAAAKESIGADPGAWASWSLAKGRLLGEGPDADAARAKLSATISDKQMPILDAYLKDPEHANLDGLDIQPPKQEPFDGNKLDMSGYLGRAFSGDNKMGMIAALLGGGGLALGGHPGMGILLGLGLLLGWPAIQDIIAGKPISNSSAQTIQAHVDAAVAQKKNEANKANLPPATGGAVDKLTGAAGNGVLDTVENPVSSTLLGPIGRHVLGVNDDTLTGAADTAGKGIVNGLGAGYQHVGDEMTQGYARAGNLANKGVGAMDAAGHGLLHMYDGQADTATQAMSGANNAVRTGLAGASNLFGAAYRSPVVQDIRNVATPIAKDVRNVAAGVGNSALHQLDPVVNTAAGVGKGLYNAAKSIPTPHIPNPAWLTNTAGPAIASAVKGAPAAAAGVAKTVVDPMDISGKITGMFHPAPRPMIPGTNHPVGKLENPFNTWWKGLGTK